MLVRLALRYLYRSLPKGCYLAQITKLLGLHLGNSIHLRSAKGGVYILNTTNWFTKIRARVLENKYEHYFTSSTFLFTKQKLEVLR